MTDLIPLDAAIAALDSHAHGKTTLGGQTYRSITLGVAVEALQAIPAIDPAAIREAALKEAVKSLRDWQHNLIQRLYPDSAITVGMAADVVEALIGEKK